MDLLSFCQWLETTPFCTAIRESSDVYPIILTCHLAALAVFGGMLMMSNLRLLEFALTDFSVEQIVGRARFWKRTGLAIMIAMGLLLFSAKAADYYANPWFRAKVVLLLLTAVHALIFRGSIYNRTAEFDVDPAPAKKARIAAWISLGLWTGIVVCGRAIGYYEIPGTP